MRFDQEYAQELDKNDLLAHFRNEFHIPQRNEKDSIYFCGNSLGLQPKVVKEYLDAELKTWQEDGVEGHFTGKKPWVDYHNTTKSSLSKLLGAEESEVVSMNHLTTNLHVLMSSFYHPKGKRTKILIEKGAFPSDHYVATSQIERMGLDADEHLILLESEDSIFETEAICEKISAIGNELALVLLPGIQYYSGQFLNMKAISAAAHEVGAYAGFDLAHAAGNVILNLHDDHVDFATWCSYKYLNSGPGGVSGIFVHEKHSKNPAFPKLKGWWGHKPSSRFQMDNNYEPAQGADAWMLSNMNILSMAAHRAALSVFDRADIHQLRKKSVQLTAYLEGLLLGDELIANEIKLLTPKNPEERGCQLSMFLTKRGKDVFDALIEAGVILDWREPNVIRIAPVPLYNSFLDVWHFYSILRGIFAR